MGVNRASMSCHLRRRGPGSGLTAQIERLGSHSLTLFPKQALGLRSPDSARTCNHDAQNETIQPKTELRGHHSGAPSPHRRLIPPPPNERASLLQATDRRAFPKSQPWGLDTV